MLTNYNKTKYFIQLTTTISSLADCTLVNIHIAFLNIDYLRRIHTLDIRTEHSPPVRCFSDMYKPAKFKI